MKPLYKFYLRKDAETYYYVDSDKTVQTSPDPVELDPFLKTGVMPDWLNFTLNYSRHQQYFGLMHSYTPDSVRFVANAAQILRYIKNNYGLNGIAQLEVWKLNRTTWMHELLDVFDIGLESHKSERYFFDAPLVKSGLSKILTSYDKTTYEVIIDNPQHPGAVSEYALIDGVALLGQYNYQLQTVGSTGTIIPIITGPGTPATGPQAASVGMLYINKEGDYAVGNPQPSLANIDFHPGVSGGDFNSARMFQQVAGSDTVPEVTVSIGGAYGTLADTINIDFADNSSDSNKFILKLFVRFFSSPDWEHEITGLNNLLWQSFNGTFMPVNSGPGPYVIDDFKGSVTNALPADTYYVFFFEVVTQNPVNYINLAGTGPGIASASVTVPNPTPVYISYNYTSLATPCWSLRQEQVLTALVNQLGKRVILPDAPVPESLPDSLPDVIPYQDDYTPPYTVYNAQSNLLLIDTPPHYTDTGLYDLNPFATRYVCGDALRVLQYDNDGNYSPPRIRTTFADFAKDAFVSNCAGVGVEQDGHGREIIRMEHLRYFFDDTTLIQDLGRKISNFTIEPYTENTGNVLTFGYSDQNYEDINGRYEFNSEFQYRSPVVPLLKDIDYKSPYRADMYGVEDIRTNLANKLTTDASSDNDTFKIVCQNTPTEYGSLEVYPLEKGQSIYTGLPASVQSSSYNLPLQVARQIARMMPFLKSNYTVNDPNLYLQTAKKNRNLTSSFNGTAYTQTDYKNHDLSTYVHSFDMPLWKPWKFGFDVEIDFDLVSAMANTPYGKFGFTIVDKELPGGSVYLEGFVLEVGCTPGDNRTYHFELLCSPNTFIPDNL